MKALNHLNKYLIQYKWHMLLGTLFIILSNIFAVYAPQVVRGAFDLMKEAIEQYGTMGDTDSAQLQLPEALQLVYSLLGDSQPDTMVLDGKMELGDMILHLSVLLAVLYFVLAVFKGIFLFFTRQTLIVMSRHIEYDLKNEIYDHYQVLDLSFYKRNNTGDLMNRISEDVSRVRMYLGPAIMYTLNLLVLFVLAISAMLSVSVSLTIYVLLPLPIMSLLIYYVSTIINKKSERVQAQQSHLSTMTQEAFSGIRVLKAFNKTHFYSEEFDKECLAYKKKQLSLVKVDALFMPTIILLIGLSTMLTIYVGGMMVINGEGGITIGNIAEFVIYVNMLTWPFAAVGWVTSLVQRAAASQERINEFLRQEPQIQNQQPEPTPVKGKIEFENVTFRYPDTGIIALKDVSFSVEPGKVLAIMGRTGTGKSTIANLICRLFEPNEGEIRIDDQDIRSLNLHSLRESIGYVPQDVFLFSDTIYNNITLNNPEISREKVIEAAKKVGAHYFINELPGNYDYNVRERGGRLSVGQRQLISFIRAYVHQPDILILDEATSSIDTESEHLIQRATEVLTEGRTSIIIAHRLSTIQTADRIIVMSKGKILEQGNHQELLQHNGHYKKLYELQFKEEDVID